MNPANLYYPILGFFLSIIWLLPSVTKAVEQAHTNSTRSPATNNITRHLYPCSIQLRSGLMIANNRDHGVADPVDKPSNNNLFVFIPNEIDVDILYVHSFFAKELESYPRIGASLLLPYVFTKNKQLRFPNLCGLLAYIELYQSNDTIATWGNRISIGAIKGGICTQAKDQPSYSIVGIKEITYHWLCTPSWQLNFSIGLLINWWAQKMQNSAKSNPVNTADHTNPNKEILNPLDNDAKRLKFAPLATIGIRYISHREPFSGSGYTPIKYSKRTRSRVDCSIAGSGRKLAATQKYHFILRGSALLSFAISAHNALLCCMELGYNWYKEALVDNMLSAGGVEITPLLGYEIRYGRYLLQLQLGYEITDFEKPTLETSNEHNTSNTLKERGRIAASIQYMLTERFFLGVSARSQEIPALRLGLSWPSND